VIAGVPATTSAVTRVSTSAQPISLNGSTMRTASGTVGPVEARDDGVVRALQQVGTVPVIEVATNNVDPLTGNYSMSLPIAAPSMANYSTTLSFSSVAASAGQYRLQGLASGFQTQTTGTLSLSSSSVQQNFTLVPTP
jgi:hypothetical protein